MQVADSRVWLVILNWNGRDDTIELLRNLAGVAASVLVVDNGSRDGTLDAVAAEFPEVHRLQTGSNLGYAGGNNLGIRHALAMNAKTVVVLNNDTLAAPDFLEPLLHVIQARPATVVSPDIRYANDPDVSWFRGSKLEPRLGWPRHLQPHEQQGAEVALISTPVLTGCCVAASAQTWRRVGLFDEGLFLMFEDSDWSMRARGHGMELYVVPASRIVHKVSRSFTGSTNLLGAYYFARNGAIFATRYLGPRGLINFAGRGVAGGIARGLCRRGHRRPAVMAALGLAASALGHRGPAGSIAQRIAAGRADVT